MLGRGLVLAALVAGLALASAAQAQSPCSDVVHLRDGGIVRGTIVEHLPEDHVTVLLITGETRTLEAARVDRVELDVGPRETAAGLSSPRRRAAPEPAARAAEPDARGDGLYVRVRGEGRPRIALYRIEPDADGADAFEPLCEAPCELRLDPGLYDLAVARDEESPRRAEGSVLELSHDTQLVARHISRSALRVGGWIMLLTGMPSSVGMIVAGIFALGLGMLIPGALLGAVSLAFWLVGGFMNDTIEVREERLVARF